MLSDVAAIVWESDAERSRYDFVSDHAQKLLGFSEERLLSPGFWASRLHPEDRVRVLAATAKAVASGEQHTLEYRLVAADEREVRLRDLVSVVVAADRTKRLRGAAFEISEAERELVRKNQRLQAIIDAAPVAIMGLDEKGNVQHLWNPGAEQMLGWRADEVLGRPMPSVPADARTEFEQIRERVYSGESIRGFEVRRHRRDGTPIEYGIYTSPLRDEAGNIDGNVGILIDVTERNRAEQALRESHQLLETIVEGTVDALYVKDLQGRYLTINSAGARWLGRPTAEIIGRTDAELVAPEIAKAIMASDQRVITTGESESFEVAGGVNQYFTTKIARRDASGKIVGVIGIARDVTELKRLEEQFRQAQKMEAVGRLAGGVAHDFNNLLTAIMGFSEVVYRGLSPDEPLRELVGEISQAGHRAATLTRQLLAFSRQQVLNPQLVDLGALLTNLSRLLQRMIGEDIELVVSCRPDLMPVRVDPGQFEQAVINLAVNGRDAMPSGGRLVLEASNVTLRDEDIGKDPDLRPGAYVMVAVTDTGQGMAEAIKSQIFEPFFTTKPLDKGTGLGLAMVYGFLKQSGGHVEVHSSIGRGTTFKVYLPSAAKTLEEIDVTPPPPSVAFGNETVLLVEDESSVRLLTEHVLGSGGYKVLVARDGREALELAKRYPGPIHLLVTDLVMPNMGGRQLAELLQQSRQDRPMRVLFISGYTDGALSNSGELSPGAAFLQKPFSPTHLARRVRDLLDATA